VCHVPESGCVRFSPAAPSVACRSGPRSRQGGSFFCALVLTADSVGSALCDPLVDGAESGVAVRVLLTFQGPGRPEADALTPSASDRRDARLRRIGSSAGSSPPGCRTRSPRRHEQWSVRRRASAAPLRWPAPAPAEAAARCEGGTTTPSSAQPVGRTFLRVATLDRRRPRPEVMPCLPAAAAAAAAGVVQVCMTGCGRVSFTAPSAWLSASWCGRGALWLSGHAKSPRSMTPGPCAGQGVGVRARWGGIRGG
jgi:hypothetical protein